MSSDTLQYAAFVQPDTGAPRIGHYDLSTKTIQPLSFISGTPISNLYQVIEAGPLNVVPSGEPISISSVTLLAPISGRDILAVGKNYAEHAKEFNSSGFDSSDKVALPSHPVIFTKRATSIAADGQPIYLHPEFTDTLDYEGEIGVIIGRPGFRIIEEEAWNHVWGYTIINDVTARERQRDHKQFFIGKSADTFCPMGPIAVAKDNVPSVLELETRVNGSLEQSATSEELIFSIPNLIKTISEGTTLQAGDVIATGTPAGVGIGKNPPVFLKPGDEISVSVTGLGTLTNKVETSCSANSTLASVAEESSLLSSNSSKTIGAGIGLTQLNDKPLHYKHLGTGSDNIVFIHGLGGTMDYWTPLITHLSLTESHSLHLFDFEGHGLSPTHPLSQLSIESIASDIKAVVEHAGSSAANPTTLIAHSMGCLAALKFTLQHPQMVRRLILIGPPPSPLPEPGSKGSYARAALVRAKGMAAVVDAVVGAGTSSRSKEANAVAVAAVRLSLLGQDPESYAKACQALAGHTEKLEMGALTMPTLIVTGEEDKVSPPSLCEQYNFRIQGSQLVVLKDVGHWHVFEDVAGVSQAVQSMF